MTGFAPAAIKPLAAMADLDKLDIRVGSIETVENVEGSEKLVKLTVDFGDHKRTILSGIKKERPNFKELVGKQTTFVVNLAPRRMAGLMSEGMLFDVGFADGVDPSLLLVEKLTPNGTRAE